MDTDWNSERIDKIVEWRDRMQLWKKNFLIIYGIFLAVVCAGLFLLDGYITQNETRQWIDHARNNERSIYYLADGLKEEEISRMSMNLNDAAKRYEESDIHIRVRVNGYIAADYFPGEQISDAAAEAPRIEVRRINGERCLVIQETGMEGDYEIAVEYAQELGSLARLQTRRMWIFCGAGLAFSGIMGLFLYYTMRRINRPVNQIAHELRTPLTGIRGYAEYLMMGKLSEEERFFAVSQIVDSAKHLEDITEKLLIMGNVREGALCIEKIEVRQMFLELEEKYPSIETDCRLEFLNGDRTLVFCLLDNLTANAVRAGDRVTVTADEEGIRIWNNGKPMDEELLRDISRGQDVPASRMGRHGYGIQVCQEIAKEHGWKLRFRSSAKEGTEVLCQIGAGYPK